MFALFCICVRVFSGAALASIRRPKSIQNLSNIRPESIPNPAENPPKIHPRITQINSQSHPETESPKTTKIYRTKPSKTLKIELPWGRQHCFHFRSHARKDVQKAPKSIPKGPSSRPETQTKPCSTKNLKLIPIPCDVFGPQRSRNGPQGSPKGTKTSQKGIQSPVENRLHEKIPPGPSQRPMLECFGVRAGVFLLHFYFLLYILLFFSRVVVLHEISKRLE